MYNYSAMNFTLPNTFETSNYMVDAMNYWSESNPNSDIAANRANGNGNALYNSRWIEDAWFIRLQNVTLSYNLASIPSLRKIFPTAKNMCRHKTCSDHPLLQLGPGISE